MSVEAFFQRLSEVLFFVVFIATTVDAIRRPRRSNFDIALLFGAPAIIILMAWTVQLLGVLLPPPATTVTQILLMALPYLLLRLLDDFDGVPWLLMRAAEAGLAGSAVALIAIEPPLPVWVTVALVAYFITLAGYAGVAFWRAAHRSQGVTRRRMEAVAAGSLFLGGLILLAGVQAVAPDLAPRWLATVLSSLLSVATGLAYFLGFAPPQPLRLAWQGPDLRAFLRRTAAVPRLASTAAVVRELEQGVAVTLGAPQASIGLWDDAAQCLRFTTPNGPLALPADHAFVRRTFDQQRAWFSEDIEGKDADLVAPHRQFRTAAMLAAPVTSGERRIGVVVAYGSHALIFAEDDLALLELLADQAAVVLESHALITQAARLQAREEATRLKDDFLSAAAHDLKTPLTSILAQAQHLERQLQRRPDLPPDLAGLELIVRESRRLSTFVTELLDVARLEHGWLVGALAPVDLTALAQEVCRRHTSERHPCAVTAVEPVIAEVDGNRLQQLLDNLLENAVKFTPNGGAVQVAVQREGDEARIAVTDQGIGIPREDMPHLFERFQRGANVNDRQFSGMGLGLYICRAIAVQHGGRIWATSVPGAGSTFHVALPITAAAVFPSSHREGVA